MMPPTKIPQALPPADISARIPDEDLGAPANQTTDGPLQTSAATPFQKPDHRYPERSMHRPIPQRSGPQQAPELNGVLLMWAARPIPDAEPPKDPVMLELLELYRAEDEFKSIITQYHEDRADLRKFDEVVAELLKDFDEKRKSQLQLQLQQLSFEAETLKNQRAPYLNLFAGCTVSQRYQAVLRRHQKETAEKRHEYIEKHKKEYDYELNRLIKEFEMRLRNHRFDFQHLYRSNITVEKRVAAWMALADQTLPDSKAALALEYFRNRSITVYTVEKIPMHMRGTAKPESWLGWLQWFPPS